jgi:hypothetical protein
MLIDDILQTRDPSAKTGNSLGPFAAISNYLAAGRLA